jgi:hypothetical protein
VVDFEDCGPPMSQIFFDVYMLLAIMVMYQLMVGVVVDQVRLQIRLAIFGRLAGSGREILDTELALLHTACSVKS